MTGSLSDLLLSVRWGPFLSCATWTILHLLTDQLDFITSRSFTFKFNLRLLLQVFGIHAVITPMVLHGKLQASTPNTPEQVMFMHVFLGFWVFDTALWLHRGLMKDKMDWLMVVHHVMAVVGMGWGSWVGRNAGPILMTLWLAELPSLFLSLRFMVRELDYHNTLPGRAIGVLTLLVMTAAYPVGGVLYFRYAVAQALSPLLLGIGLVVLVMNLFWYCLYVGRALGLIRKAAKPQPPAAEPQKADKIQ